MEILKVSVHSVARNQSKCKVFPPKLLELKHLYNFVSNDHHPPLFESCQETTPTPKKHQGSI